MAQAVRLESGLAAVVDDGDFPFVCRFRWYGTAGKYTWYAWTKIDGKTVHMHRLLLEPPKGMVVDHINGDGLDNRRENLRVATYRQNMANRRKHSSGTSKFLGVDWWLAGQRWRARLRVGTRLFVRYTNSEREAAAMYSQMVREHFGEFAPLDDLPDLRKRVAWPGLGQIGQSLEGRWAEKERALSMGQGVSQQDSRVVLKGVRDGAPS